MNRIIQSVKTAPWIVYEQVRKGSPEQPGEKVRTSKTCQDDNQPTLGPCPRKTRRRCGRSGAGARLRLPWLLLFERVSREVANQKARLLGECENGAGALLERSNSGGSLRLTLRILSSSTNITALAITR